MQLPIKISINSIEEYRYTYSFLDSCLFGETMLASPGKILISKFALMTGVFLFTVDFVMPTTLAQDDAESSQTSDPDFSQWVKTSPTGANASFMMPNKPRYRERTFSPVQNQPPIRVRQHQSTTKGGKSTFLFGYHDLNKPPVGYEEVEQTIYGAIGGSVVRLSGRLLDDPRTKSKKAIYSIKYGKNPGKEFNYKFANQGKTFRVKARILIFDKRQYFLQAIFEEDAFDEQIADYFLNKFTYLSPDSDLPPRPPVPPKKSGDNAK